MSVYAFMETLKEKHTKMPTVLPDICTAFLLINFLCVCVCHVWCLVVCACVICGYVWCLGV